MKQKPNLFIVGEPKSGTTALASFLDQHLEVFISKPKEPHYFCKDLHKKSDKFHNTKRGSYYKFRTLKQYLKIFKNKDEKILGDASVYYLYSTNAAKNIFRFNPNAKIIIMLREPISFLHSIHNEYLNATFENIEDFERAINKESDREKGIGIPKRVRDPSYLFYSRLIKYSEQLNRYLDIFPKNHVKIIIFDDFKKDNEKEYREILNFLEINTKFLPDFKTIHESKKAKSKIINSIIRNPVAIRSIRNILPLKTYDNIQLGVKNILMKKEKREPLDPLLRKKLMKRYKPEVVKLSKLLKRDLVKEWGYDKIK